MLKFRISNDRLEIGDPLENILHQSLPITDREWRAGFLSKGVEAERFYKMEEIHEGGAGFT